ncbi:MAG: imidazolonepropionase [Flavobacteriaceae bacterium]|nr:imidazolonepropionase [Flavobacteriaceae bacterium]
MRTLITDIKELLQVRENPVKKVSGSEMKILPSIKNAYLLIENDRISDFGPMESLKNMTADSVIEANGKMVLPAWCDSHTHIVYAGNREGEFVDRINGLSYEEIAARGGGILNSARKLQHTPEDELYAQSAARVEEVMTMGTGALEIKSGYGLTTEAEIKMLRVIQRLRENYPLAIKSTFLGAHAFPSEFQNDKDAYVNLIIDEMLPRVAREKLADFVDVFCEKGYFSVEQTDRILTAARQYCLIPKIHVNQFSILGGVQTGVKNHALSVDHLEELDENDIVNLQGSGTMPVALPSCSYFLSIPYTPARKIIDAGLPLALATDYNPGSTPSGNMNFVVSTACIKMNMSPEEAINAATINGAYAMNLSDTHGSITKGKKANLIITKEIPSYGFLPYAFGSDLIDRVLINGKSI